MADEDTDADRYRRNLRGEVDMFAAGALGWLFTRQPVLHQGVRQAGFGMAAAGITFALGKMVGTGLGL